MKPTLPKVEIKHVRETTLCVTFPGPISIEINRTVLALAERIGHLPALKDWSVSTAYTSIGLTFEGALKEFKLGNIDLIKILIFNELRNILELDSAQPSNKKIIEIPVCYDPIFGEDLEALSVTLGLSLEEIIKRHSEVTYHVFMNGFMPGFPYMGMVHTTLETTRRITPRVRVPAGSVAIAGKQTGIYPFATPGGWNIVGRTPLKLFDATRPEPSLLQAGDRVTFVPISKRQFDSLLP